MPAEPPKSGWAESDLTISRPYISRSLRAPSTKNSCRVKVSEDAPSRPWPACASGKPPSAETRTQSNDPAKPPFSRYKRGQDDMVTLTKRCAGHGGESMRIKPPYLAALVSCVSRLSPGRSGSIVFGCKRWWRHAFVAMAASLPASGQAVAAVPPASTIQNNSNAVAVDKLLADAHKALADGNFRVALIYLKNAVGAAPQNTTARVELGKLLLESGKAGDAEQELRQARR